MIDDPALNPYQSPQPLQDPLMAEVVPEPVGSRELRGKYMLDAEEWLIHLCEQDKIPYTHFYPSEGMDLNTTIAVTDLTPVQQQNEALIEKVKSYGSSVDIEKTRSKEIIVFRHSSINIDSPAFAPPPFEAGDAEKLDELKKKMDADFDVIDALVDRSIARHDSKDPYDLKSRTAKTRTGMQMMRDAAEGKPVTRKGARSVSHELDKDLPLYAQENGQPRLLPAPEDKKAFVDTAKHLRELYQQNAELLDRAAQNAFFRYAEHAYESQLKGAAAEPPPPKSVGWSAIKASIGTMFKSREASHASTISR